MIKSLKNWVRILPLLLFIFTLIFSFPSFCLARGLVIVGWDGAGLNNVAPMMQAGRLSNLQNLTSKGQIIPVIPVTATLTVPSFSAIFTGLTPDVTTVHGNKHYEGWSLETPWHCLYWIWSIPWSWTFPAALQKTGVKVGWFISKGSLGTNSLKSSLCWVARKADQQALMMPRNGLLTYAENLTTLAESFISSQNGDFFVFLHLDPDRWGHLFGENSPEYLAEFERCDVALGRIMALQGLHDFKIMVMNDHGFNEGTNGHPSAADLWIASDLLFNPKWQEGGATNLDMAPTALKYFGLGKHHRQAYGKSLTD